MKQVHLLALQQIDLNFANKGFAGFYGCMNEMSYRY